MKKPSFYKPLALMFLLLVGGFFILNIMKPEKAFSDTENRALEGKPRFTLDNIFEGKFTKSYEKYISDQFSFRDGWVKLKTTLELGLGKREINGVIVGQDNYLLQNVPKYNELDLNKKIFTLQDFAKKQPNVKTNFMPVPNSVKVLEQKLPAYFPVTDQKDVIGKLERELENSFNIINVLPALESKKNEYIYYRTDHHWTTKGAYYAYRELCDKVGIKPASLSEFVVEVKDGFYGTLQSKAQLIGLDYDKVEIYQPKNMEDIKVEYIGEDSSLKGMFDKSYLEKKDKYSVFFGGNHPLIKVTNVKTEEKERTSLKKLLIIKDSYANSIIPFLTTNYDEIYVLDLRYYGDSVENLISKNEIKDVLFIYNINSFLEENSLKRLVD